MELWERQLAQPQVTLVSLALPSLQQSVFISHCLCRLSDHGRNGKGITLSLKSTISGGKNPFPFLLTPSNLSENTTLLVSVTRQLSLQLTGEPYDECFKLSRFY